MPIFEYHCPRCGHVFEHFWRGAERREELRCPRCGAEHVEKRLSVFGTSTGASVSVGSAGASCGSTGGG